MNRPKLSLDVSLDRQDSFEGMEATYRREGLTVGANYMRIDGVNFDVRYFLDFKTIMSVYYLYFSELN